MSKTMYKGINNSPIATLTADIAANATSIPVFGIAAFPEAPNIATIGTEEDAELVLYTGISGSSLTGCTRGFNDTTAKAWAAGESIYRAFTAYDYDALVENLMESQKSTEDAEAAAKKAEKAIGDLSLSVDKLHTVETGSITLTNTLKFPFNDSQKTVALQLNRDNTNYIVVAEASQAAGNVGEIVVSEQLVNGFKIEYTGSASSVTVGYKVIGGLNK